MQNFQTTGMVYEIITTSLDAQILSLITLHYTNICCKTHRFGPVKQSEKYKCGNVVL